MNKYKKALCALMAALTLTGLTACGGTAGSTATGTTGSASTAASTSAAASNGAATTPSSAMTDAEYEEAVTNLSTQMQDIQTKAASLDATDTEGAKSLIEEMKKPFTDFTAITPPEKYAEAHTKLKSGCESMAAYCDDMLALLGGDTAAATKMTEDLQAASNALTEGSTLMSSAK